MNYKRLLSRPQSLVSGSAHFYWYATAVHVLCISGWQSMTWFCGERPMLRTCSDRREYHQFGVRSWEAAKIDKYIVKTSLLELTKTILRALKSKLYSIENPMRELWGVPETVLVIAVASFTEEIYCIAQSKVLEQLVSIYVWGAA